MPRRTIIDVPPSWLPPRKARQKAKPLPRRTLVAPLVEYDDRLVMTGQMVAREAEQTDGDPGRDAPQR